MLSFEALRPTELEEVVGQSAVVGRLSALAEGVRSGRLIPPHLLFVGPPGVGKTTAARAFGRRVLGEHFENSFHEMGALDDRGAATMRGRIGPLTRVAPSRGAPVRFLFPDEVDQLAFDSFGALRAAMEGQSRSVFLLACNSAGPVPAAIRSRCTTMEFGTLSRAEMHALVRRMLDRAKRTLSESEIDRILKEASGIPRDAVRLLVERGAVRPEMRRSNYGDRVTG